MGSIEATKAHAVCVPFPAQGHVNPMMQLAKLLHSKGFHITFVNTEFNHRRLIRSRGPDSVKGLPDFRFETIPDGLPPSDRDATQDVPSLFYSTRKNCLAPFLELLDKLNSSAKTNAGASPVTCIIADGIMGFAVEAARMLGILDVQFWTASACGFVAYLQFAELPKRGILPFKDQKFLTDGTLLTPVDWIPGMSNMRLKDLPSFARVTDVNDIQFDFLGSEAQHCLKSSAIIINTFDELEVQVLDVIASMFPNIYTIGPLPLLREQVGDNRSESLGSSLWKEDYGCLKWLDNKEPDSVVYVNYGSITVMTEQHLREFAWGLANSKHPFLWIVRPDVVKEGSASAPAVLPEEFFEEIKDRGLIASWCMQEKVLTHPSVGAFLTHCGWNSTSESICAGKPVICWPFFAEQQTNCRYACTTWGVGMEVDHDVKRDEIEALVKEMMEGDEGMKLRKNAQDWKKKAEEATAVGGQSYDNFEKLVRLVAMANPSS